MPFNVKIEDWLFVKSKSSVLPFLCAGTSMHCSSPLSSKDYMKSFYILSLIIGPSGIGQETPLRLKSPTIKIFLGVLTL